MNYRDESICAQDAESWQAMAVATFIMSWEGSEVSYPSTHFANDVITTASGTHVSGRWSMGLSRSGASADDRIYLLRRSLQRGIVAAGRLVDGDISSNAHWADVTRYAFYCDIIWDRVLDIVNRLPIEQLLANAPGHSWSNVMGSGQQLRPDTAAIVHRLWET